MLDVTCCVYLHSLLHVVGCSCAKFETGQTFQPTTPNIYFVPWSPKRNATMLDPFAQLFQHCWGHPRSLRIVYKDLRVVSFQRCTAGPNFFGSCCIRLQTTPIRTQQLPTLSAEDCWELLRPFARSLTSNVRFEFVGFTRGVECIINTAVVNIGAHSAVLPVAPKRTGSGRTPILCTGNRSGILFAYKGENP